MSESIAQVDDAAIGINIAGTSRHGMSATALYHCTRGTWRVSRSRANKAQYAFSVYRGVVREVYEIHEWLPSGSTEHSFGADGYRSEFVGKVAPDKIRDKYVGKRLESPPGQNPIRYYNC